MPPQMKTMAELLVALDQGRVVHYNTTGTQIHALVRINATVMELWIVNA